MTKDTITIYDMETGEEITREMTADEAAQLNQAKTKAAEDIAATESKAAAKAALLERLGITADEAALLLG